MKNPMRQKSVFNIVRKIQTILAAILICFYFAACEGPPPQQEPAVARVGAEALTVSDILNDIPSEFRHRLNKNELQDYAVRWIDSQILYQEGQKRRLDQTAYVRRELRRLERELVVNALLDQELNKTFAATEPEIEKYYNDNRQTFIRNVNEIHVQHLRVNNKQTADSLVAALRQGGDFLRIARHYTGNSSPPGDSLEIDLYLTEAETPPAVASAVFTIMAGAISRPIELDNGFHIFKMVEKFPAGSQRALALVRDEITAKIQSEKRQERYRQLLAQLKNNAPVEKNFSLLDHVVVDSFATPAEQK
jgi:parvulin-like peptidyl-prolyl isomerase